ncbi:MAG: Trk system potassium transporter TrkA [Bacteroidales bacterium]|nr:Trk system potassium transporter TrkA [Bacteroidales bacterium]
MRIIIAGAGEVGYYLARLFDQELHEIIVIDNNPERLKRVEDNLGIVTILGDSTSYKILKEVKVETADMLIAVTEWEAVNIVTAITSKKLGAKYTIARISNMEYLLDKKTLDLHNLGIDELISPESLTARVVKHILKEPLLTESLKLYDDKLIMMGLHIEDQAPVINKTIAETTSLNPENCFIIVAIHRKGETIIPKGQTQIKKGDYLYFIATNAGKDKVLKYCGKVSITIKKLLILGGSRTGARVAGRLCQYYDIKLIEKDINKCKELALNLPKVQIVHGDGTNVKLLEDEEFGTYDAFVAVTENSETNIFTCLMAKETGVKKTIAMVENIGLFNHSLSIGIDTLINKKLAAANFIFKNIHNGGIYSFLYGLDAEILEFEVGEKSRVTQKIIKDIDFSALTIITSVVRNGNAYIALGNFQLQSKDKVVVFTLSKDIRKVEAFFN